MPLKNFLKDELIKLNLHCESYEQVFEVIYEEAFARGYVSESFFEKIKEREATFPTGLDMGTRNVAIPHTDPEYVHEQFIGIITLEKPVLFSLMDDASKTVEVNIIFMLGLNQPHSQLTVLQNLMQVIQDEEGLERILEAKNNEEIYSFFNELAAT
ncbi:PTS sugar transporter subunit IIA [Halalkalibacterium ligniniphilum]|uniref:PTS sugar transporter subunit IIA n=1 Tax=Halalkalibacterium ligniniphilum TaxID=1134413 RepID=UPI000347ADA8|nr:PTS sugar transporter subunit IIA [Halalkalibacterium ligniniphilum]